MKPIKTILFVIGIILTIFPAEPAKAQFMPVVYDHTYGKENTFNKACADFQNGDLVAAGMSDGKVFITWIDRNGESRFSRRFNPDDLSVITGITSIAEDKILVTGARKTGGKNDKRATGCALILNISGSTERNITTGENGAVITFGRMLKNESLILSGNTPRNGEGIFPFICKISGKDQILYTYTGSDGETCDWFDTMGSNTEYVNAAFSSLNGKGCSVVRLDDKGKPFFITVLPDSTFRIEKMASAMDGNIYLAGEGTKAGGAVLKIRPEGDIVFNKQIVPAGPRTRLNLLVLSQAGEILTGGSDEKKAYFSLLRPDGTELSSNVDNGEITGITANPANGECIVSLYDAQAGYGKIIKFSRQGKRLYEKNTAAAYSVMRINSNGDLLLASPRSGRLSMVSKLGELLFDRYVVENTPQNFEQAYLPVNGEALFIGTNARAVKLAHGLYVNDIAVNKPISGYTSAVFTITLSGYSYSKEGAPQPVTVNYRTRPVTAAEGLNYDTVSGTLSFVPSVDRSERYMNTFTVEVPVNANDLLEGERIFELDLYDVKQSYLIRSGSRAVIEDQPAIIKLTGTTPGMEGEKDITYELGIFKTNGTPLVNATKADIVIDGTYGNGTADKLDFDMGRMPRLVIAPGRHNGRFDVVTLEDTRYESVKTVMVNFNKVFAMSDTQVSFGSNMLSCEGLLYDQPAMVAIESLGDHNKLNNVLTGLFRISLVRAKDGVLLTNNSGSDIILTPDVNESSTAAPGQDFVLANSHDLRIWGDEKSSAVNLNGMILYSAGNEKKTVSVTLAGVKAGENAGRISVDPERNTARFLISKQQ